MKKLALFMMVLVLGISSMFSCKAKDDAPEGLQTADVRESEGYIFYAPEHWAVINSESVSAAKVSAINNTSITFTEADVPAGTVPEYFDESMASFTAEIKESYNLVIRDEKCNFGNANGECLKYVYTYKYEGFDFACMQILINHDDRFFIFTYTSYGDVNNELSDYRTCLDRVQLAIDSFRFTDITETNEAIEYNKDADGYNMVSNTKLSGFELYLPADCEVIYSEAYVKAKFSTGANISISKATSTGVSISDYWKNRKDELSRFVTNVEEVAVNTVNDPSTPETEVIFGNLDPTKIASYEYKYTFGGKVYHVYQVMGVSTFSGYVFTYTALEDEYSEHIDEVKIILEKVKF